MRKKKTTILLALLSVTFLTGCCDDEEKVDGDVIRFDTSIGGVNTLTRSAITTENFKKFNVTALGDASPYFQDLEVQKQADGAWETATPKYWPSYPLKFYGYAPQSLKDRVSITTTAQTIGGFTPAKTVRDQEDVITAYVLANRNSASGAAVLDFKHALSQIEVLAKNGSPSQYTVEVLGVKLGQIPSTAELAFQTANDGYPTWSVAAGNADYILKGTSSLTLDRQARSIMFGSHTFLMIPQELTPWSANSSNNGGAYISVLCRIKDQLGNLLYPSVATKYGFAALPIKQEWTTGHKYTYTIAFFTNGGGAGLIDPNPLNPEDPEDPDVDPNPGGPGKGPGDQVVPDSELPITVTVNITDWLSGPDDQIDIEF